MKTRIVSLVLCLILLISFCGCDKAQQVRMLTEYDIIGQDGCFLYTIISAEGNTGIEGAEKEANNLKKQIGEAFDIKVNTSTDKKIAADSELYEILLGNTNRAESTKAYETLKENRVQNINDWIIKVIDNKICIVAMDDANLAKAIRYFNVNYCTKLSDFSKVSEDFEYIDTKSYDVKNADNVSIAGNRIGEYTIITAREKSLLYTLKLSELVEIFAEKYGISISQGRDTETKESKYEIIIGDTNRSVNGIDKPKGDNYVIAMDGDKLIVNGGSDIAIAAAVQRLLDLEAEARKSNENFEIPKGFKEEGKATANSEDYKYAWSDEFNGPLNTSVWTDPLGDPSSSPSPNGGTTYSRGIQTVFTRDGCAVLPGRRLNDVDFDCSDISSYQTFAFRYGILEVRAKLPPTPMIATMWGAPPSFSMENGKRNIELTPKNYHELDLLENFGQPDWFASNVHQWIVDGSKHRSLDGTKYAEQKKYVYPEGEAFNDEFHIFSCEWTPYGIKYSVDGEVYFHYDTSTMENIGFLQTPVDLRFSGGFSNASYHLQKKIPDDAPEYGEYLIDYIRVYQTDKYDNILWYDPVE